MRGTGRGAWRNPTQFALDGIKYHFGTMTKGANLLVGLQALADTLAQEAENLEAQVKRFLSDVQAA